MKPLDKDLNILYLDNHILVVLKEANLPTQGASEEEDSLTQRASNYLKEKFLKPGRVFLHPIHRLDRAVSGIVLFARTSKALSRLQKMMREKKITREYIAKVEGKILEKENFLEHLLIHDEFKARVVEKKSKEAKLARLTFQVIKSSEKESIVKIILETGRYHQIRAQFAAIGHPIVGDTKYGSKTSLNRIFLHHQRMIFIHPVTQKEMEFFSLPNW